MQPRSLLVLALVTATAAGCTTSSPTAPPTTSGSPSPAGDSQPVTHGRALAGALIAGDDCPALLNELKRRAAGEVTAYGLPGMYGGWPGGYGIMHGAIALRTSVTVPAPAYAVAGPMKQADTAGTPAGAGSGYSTTNNQEAGVDEPDLAKTDGEILAMVRQRPRGPVLRLIDVSTSPPSQAGKVWLKGMTDGRLFLDGDRAIVVGGAERPEPSVQNPRGRTQYTMWAPPLETRVATVDISDPLHPRVTREVTVPGALVDARFLAGRVLTVTQSSPSLQFEYPRRGGQVARHEAKLANQRTVAQSTIEDWLPPVQSDSGQAWPVSCKDVYRPSRSSGLGTVSVTSIDPASDEPGRRATVVADASVVYASTDALYLATNDWDDRGWLRRGDTARVRTHLHEFDLTNPNRPQYVGSGSVRGSVIDQYALSEQDGYLRVATTVGDATAPAWEGGKPAGRLSDNVMTVLQARNDELVQVGQLTGLGRGEQIYSVRYFGDVGYVVTFQQTDPLFVLDLSDPTDPRLRGELKVTGYSSYLHPLGGDLLLGLGQAVDGRLRTEGVQTSVFDVSDLDHPALRDRMHFGPSWSGAEGDPHQFLWWPERRLVIVPVERYMHGDDTGGDAVLHVGDDGMLRLVGWLRQPGSRNSWESRIDRAIVVDDVLYTISQGGVLASDINSLATRTWLPFG